MSTKPKKKKGVYGDFIDGCLPLEVLMEYWVMPFILAVLIITVPCWLPLYIFAYIMHKLFPAQTK